MLASDCPLPVVVQAGDQLFLSLMVCVTALRFMLYLGFHSFLLGWSLCLPLQPLGYGSSDSGNDCLVRLENDPRSRICEQGRLEYKCQTQDLGND
jgi:hypothetical protein